MSTSSESKVDVKLELTEEPPNWDDNLLSVDFDNQLKLVEKSICFKNTLSEHNKRTETKNDDEGNSKRSSKNNKVNKMLEKQTITPARPNEKLSFSNKSRIYRFEEAKQENHPTTVPILARNECTTDERDARASMLQSWYMAGYHTGYYEAMKKLGGDRTGSK